MKFDVEIQKILCVETPEQFYRILFDQNWMVEGVDNFLKSYFKWQYGCPCDSEELWQEVVNQFRLLSDDNLVGLKNKIGCDKIEFRYDNNKS